MSEKRNTFVIIDSGNTALKYAIFGEEKVKYGSDFEQLKSDIDHFEIQKGLISNVASSAILEEIKLLIPDIHILTESSKIPISNLYKTPATLGRDRLANAVAIAHLSARQNALCIDVGTCLKFDFVDQNNNYRGGSIAPGLQMRFSAMHHFTANLPLIEVSALKTAANFDLIGTDTKGSLVSGALKGMKNEINEGIGRYVDRYENLNIYLTGGDAHFFENEIKYRIFADPNLTLHGLKIIFEAND